MAGEKIIPKTESAAPVMKTNSSKFINQDLDTGKNATPSVLTSANKSSAGDATTSIKGENGQKSVAEQSVYNPPTNYYDYSYPGYDGNFGQTDKYNYSDSGGGSYSGFPTDNSSLLYYMPGYDPYASGSFMGLDGQQQYYSSPGYSYGPEAMQSYPYNSAYYGDATSGTNGFAGKSKSALGSNSSVKSSNFKSVKPSGSVAGRSSMFPYDSKAGNYFSSSNISKAMIDSQAYKSWGKVGSGYQTPNSAKGLFPFNKYSSLINQSQGLLMDNTWNTYKSNNRIWNGNNRFMPKDNNGDLDATTELTCGPRVHSGTNPSNPPQEQTGPVIRRDQYNSEEFKTEYENAKFFIIKSYSEDDVHKCVKYDVWSSTPNGNKKLNAVYNDMEAKSLESGQKIPIFLFFSVNGSGQFVGVAEMLGPVDSRKDMEFWQLDKWNGFFPLKWHIVKDMPNSQLRHIILENNDNRPVTYSRDTQEIGLKQGIEMLNIFKSFSGKSSILDDFNFYDIREKSLRAKRISKQGSGQMESRTGESDLALGSNGSSDATSSLINLTRNLSLNSRTLKSGASVGNTSESSIPSGHVA